MTKDSLKNKLCSLQPASVTQQAIVYLCVPRAYYDSTVTLCAAVVQHLWKAAIVNDPSCTQHVLYFVKSGGYNHVFTPDLRAPCRWGN